NPSNQVLQDRENRTRSGAGPAGAWLLPANVTITTVLAANYRSTLAPETIVAGFGNELAAGSLEAAENPLPTKLLTTTITVTDSAGVNRAAPLFYVSRGQVNFLIPSGTASGRATITLVNGSVRATGEALIAPIAPGIFTADASGSGTAAAQAYRVRSNQPPTYEPVVRVAAASGQLEPIPIDLGPEGDLVYLLLYGTGWRNRSSVTLTIGGTAVPIGFSGAHYSLVGLDQINALIPRSLIGRGVVDVALTVDGQAANTVRIAIR
ncbi:MAG: hypothetical protein EBZ36_04335, partial [Acidobacteria bacterium]|nr:hypothetical protein [Acidobacteriota bacterium]